MSQRLKHQVTLILVILGILVVFTSAWPQVGWAQITPTPPEEFPEAESGGVVTPAPNPVPAPAVNNNPVEDADLNPNPPLLKEGDVVTPDEESTIIRIFYKFVTGVFGVLVGFFGTIFDYAVENYIFGFGAGYNNTGLGGIIDSLWTTIRDVINLAFIFGLVWIGFQMILNNKTDAQRALGMLIAAALLVNFSLFITKFIVDFTNIAAAQIYNAIKIQESGSLGKGFIAIIGLPSAYGAEPGMSQLVQNGFVYVFCLMMVLIVTSFVFAAGAILIIIRYIALNLYLVFSPIMFIGWIFPGMANYSRDYWKGFLGRAFFAPAFIFMIYLSYSILGSYQERGESIRLGDTLAGGAKPDETGETLAFFILAMGFMLASLVVAQKMGANGATAAISVGQRMRRGTQSYITGQSARFARNGIDRLASSDKDTFGGRTMSRILTHTGARDYLDRTYQKSTAGKIATSSKAISQSLSRRDTLASNARDRQAGVDTAEELTAIRNKIGPLTADETTRLRELEETERKMHSAVTDLTTGQLEEMSVKERNGIAHLLTANQTENLLKSDKISETDKGGVMKVRKEAIKKLIEKNNTVIGSELAKLSIAQIETMGSEWIRENGHLFTNSQMDDIKKSKNFTERQKGDFSAVRKINLGNIAKSSDIKDFEQVMKERKPSEVAYLGIDILSSEIGISLLNENIIEAIANDKKTMGKTDRDKLENELKKLKASPTTLVSSAHAKKLLDTISSPSIARNW